MDFSPEWPQRLGAQLSQDAEKRVALSFPCKKPITMLKKKHRLHHASDIQSLLRQGRRIKVGDFFLFIKKGNGLGNSRYTVIVGKKFSPLATARNRQKRVLKAVLQEIEKNVEKQVQCDVIIMCTSKGKVLSYKDAKNSILPVFKRNCGI